MRWAGAGRGLRGGGVSVTARGAPLYAPREPGTVAQACARGEIAQCAALPWLGDASAGRVHSQASSISVGTTDSVLKMKKPE